jgi:hypothetical protein
VSAVIGIVSLAFLGAITIYSLIDWKHNSEVPLGDDEIMLAYLRANPDHHVSTADTEYTKHRSY